MGQVAGMKLASANFELDGEVFAELDQRAREAGAPDFATWAKLALDRPVIPRQDCVDEQESK